jgi:hypothetical protein
LSAQPVDTSTSAAAAADALRLPTVELWIVGTTSTTVERHRHGTEGHERHPGHPQPLSRADAKCRITPWAIRADALVSIGSQAQ